MEALATLERRIDNVKDMQSVITTMKTLAAVSIRQYEAAVQALVDYDHTIERAFQILMRHRPLSSRPQESVSPRTSQATGVVVFGSDQGMCGQFNDQIARHALASMSTPTAGNERWHVLAIGSRVRGVLEDADQSVDATFSVPVSASDITRLLQELLPRIQTWQAERHIDKLYVVYNQRTSAATCRPHGLELLPISEDRLATWRETPWRSRSLPTFTMSWEDLLSKSVRQYLFVSLFRACAESLASENASRIASMQLAEKNIEERLEELTTQFSQLRQTAITEELLDVVTGFEALRHRSR